MSLFVFGEYFGDLEGQLRRLRLTPSPRFQAPPGCFLRPLPCRSAPRSVWNGLFLTTLKRSRCDLGGYPVQVVPTVAHARKPLIVAHALLWLFCVLWLLWRRQCAVWNPQIRELVQSYNFSLGSFLGAVPYLVLHQSEYTDRIFLSGL